MNLSVSTTLRKSKNPGKFWVILFCLAQLGLYSCSSSRKTVIVPASPANAWDVHSVVTIKDAVPAVRVNVKKVQANDLVRFALTLQGIPYKYGSAKKENGFDCSGFINYVFNHFDISVPRSTVNFTNAGSPVTIRESAPGDLILFTGSDAHSGVVGHMGIVVRNEKDNFQFIHASTSKGVMLSGLNSYFIPRFVKVIRFFKP